jgi:hypothetical protein
MEKPPVILAPGRKPKGRLFRTVVALPLTAFGCMVFLAFLAIPRPPKESKVIQNFYNNRTAFEQLRDMLKEDPHLRRVAGWGVETSNPFYLGDASASGFPMDRYRRYLALLKQARGDVTTRGEGEHCGPSVLVWAWGWAGDTRHLGICWMEETPTNQISTLDGHDERSQYPGRRVAFKRLDENWYLWTDF